MIWYLKQKLKEIKQIPKYYGIQYTFNIYFQMKSNKKNYQSLRFAVGVLRIYFIKYLRLPSTYFNSDNYYVMHTCLNNFFPFFVFLVQCGIAMKLKAIQTMHVTVKLLTLRILLYTCLNNYMFIDHY